MSKINILDSSVFNKIAAGEVVERPSSVVKELLDNSIDALSTRIIVKIEEGGIKKISVFDNGSGIEKEDFDRVFLAHATSKIKTSDDLEKIGTLGFRGEALASIGAVSNATLTSKTKEQTFGYKMTVSGGKQTEIVEFGCPTGTTIEIENLFFNVPARAKFLKKPRQEQTEITNLIARYILANPNIAISYFADETEVFSSTGNGLKEALFVVYGKDILQNLCEVDYNTTSKIKVSGWIGKPTFTKPNRTYQTLIVNGRYVVNNMVSVCVYNAYERYLMKGQFPFYVLRLDIPYEKLDVNVHPNKMDIRFENSNEIYGIVYNAITTALSNASSQVNVAKLTTYNKVESGTSFNYKSEPKSVEINTVKLVTPTNQNSQEQPKTDFYENFFHSQVTPTLNQNSNPFKLNTIQNISNEEKADQVQQQSMFANEGVKFIGTIFNTYLIVETKEKCYLIDQHAAHERLLFDKFKNEVDKQSISTQMLLIPFNLNVNHLEKEFMDKNLQEIKNLGFLIEPFGNLSYKITSIPSILKNINLNYFFSSILGDLSVFKQLKQSDLIIEKLMQHACKSAVKAGYILTSNDVLSLLEQMEKEKMELQCPHGRPVVVELSQKEIEKWFKRVV